MGQSTPVFIWSPEEEVYDRFAEASKWWLASFAKSSSRSAKTIRAHPDSSERFELTHIEGTHSGIKCECSFL